MLAPNFVIARLERGEIQYLHFGEPVPNIEWSIVTATTFGTLQAAMDVAKTLKFSVDIKSINFVGKVNAS